VLVGEHRIQLRIVNTGKSTSAEFIVDVRADETRVLRTRRHTLKEYQQVPLGIVNPTSSRRGHGSGWSLLHR